MRVLIVENNLRRGEIWQRFLIRQGVNADLVPRQEDAISMLGETAFDVLVINITSSDPNILAVTDVAAFRNPNIAIIAVTSGSFFSDGSIFQLLPNARGCVSGDVPLEDLAAMVQHYGEKSGLGASAQGPRY
ncbi:response regulator [Amylibacter marinus]|uniref:Response regulator n=1 Tax=Amylibacter marinus TaxID=1475483 RepID=A0ABQ5VW27_9RHOB|nr:hypothetical protein [Amylibacter marinus]GLQ35276.1 response regulator [Amylibacter marinus]